MSKHQPTAAAVADPTADVPAREPLTPIEAFWLRADALYRSAKECCRQHERFSQLVDLSLIHI